MMMTKMKMMMMMMMIMKMMIIMVTFYCSSQLRRPSYSVRNDGEFDVGQSAIVSSSTDESDFDAAIDDVAISQSSGSSAHGRQRRQKENGSEEGTGNCRMLYVSLPVCLLLLCLFSSFTFSVCF